MTDVVIGGETEHLLSNEEVEAGGDACGQRSTDA